MAQTALPRARDQAKEATRRALLGAGLAETIDRGGVIPSIAKICSRAGFTRGAFYVHFRDREQFVGELLDWVLNDIVQALFAPVPEGEVQLADVIAGFHARLAAGSWPDVDSHVRASYLAVLAELRPGTPVQERHATLMHGVAARLADLARRGQDDGTVRGDLDPDQLAYLLLMAAIGAVVWSGTGILEGLDLAAAVVRILPPT